MTKHSSGQARVRLAGKAHYLGEFGTPAAHEAYAALVRAYVDNGRMPLAPMPTVVRAGVTVADLLAQFDEHVERTGRYSKGGRPTTQRGILDCIRDSFAEFAGKLPVHRLSEAVLVQWRDRLEASARLTRRGINRKVGGLLGILRWGRARGLVSKQVWADVSSIEPLKRGECGSRPETGRPRRAVSLQEVEQVAAHAPTCIGAMLRLQALTGMRPGEVCAMRWADIDKAAPAVDGVSIWLYTVHEGKTAHHGHATRYALPPAAQKILNQFPALPKVYIFRPEQAVAEHREQLRASRRTPPTKQMRQRDDGRTRTYCERWDANSYRKVVERACLAAGVEKFSPHEVRHGFATWAAASLGVLAASVALNHRNLSTTQRYLHADPADAFKAAAAVQRRVSG